MAEANRNAVQAARQARGAAASDPVAVAGSVNLITVHDGFTLRDDFLILMNAWWEPLEFVLRIIRLQATSQVEIDTPDPVPQTGRAAAGRLAAEAGPEVTTFSCAGPPGGRPGTE